MAEANASVDDPRIDPADCRRGRRLSLWWILATLAVVAGLAWFLRPDPGPAVRVAPVERVNAAAPRPSILEASGYGSVTW